MAAFHETCDGVQHFEFNIDFLLALMTSWNVKLIQLEMCIRCVMLCRWALSTPLSSHGEGRNTVQMWSNIMKGKSFLLQQKAVCRCRQVVCRCSMVYGVLAGVQCGVLHHYSTGSSSLSQSAPRHRLVTIFVMTACATMTSDVTTNKVDCFICFR